MTVQELSAQLARFNPTAELVGRLPDGRYAHISVTGVTDQDGRAVLELHLTDE